MANHTVVIVGSDEETRQKLAASVSDRLRNLRLLGGENPASVVTRKAALIIGSRTLRIRSDCKLWVGCPSPEVKLLLLGAGKNLTSADFAGYEIIKAQRVYLPATESEPDCVVSSEGVVCSGNPRRKRAATAN
jgi:hypothetical protein